LAYDLLRVIIPSEETIFPPVLYIITENFNYLTALFAFPFHTMFIFSPKHPTPDDSRRLVLPAFLAIHAFASIF